MPSANNPYAAPKAMVDDVDDGEHGVQLVSVFSWKGRLGRLRFLAYNLLAYVAMVIGLFLVALLIMFFGGSQHQVNNFLYLALIPYGVLAIMWGIQRSHDMNWSGWTVLIACIPVVGLVWIAKAGTKGRNSFGSPPPPNGLFVKIMGLCLPVVGIIGIVAAIALPAYQGYAQRAKANQVIKP
jgi:uncharacterized membrane protein YhaH (DUF805 family)